MRHKAEEFVKAIARLKMDGERMDDGTEFGLTPDDAAKTLLTRQRSFSLDTRGGCA